MKPRQARRRRRVLIAHYREKVVPELKQKLGYKNVMAVPRLEKIVISMGLGKFATAGEKDKVNAGREGTVGHRRPEAAFAARPRRASRTSRFAKAWKPA